MVITSKKTYEPGDIVTCIIASSSSLEQFKEYTVKTSRHGCVYLENGKGEYNTSGYNPARFISKKEVRESKINKILDK